jgi:hypothetical protein
MKTKWLFVLGVCLCGLTRLHAQGTAFTYQGRLVDQGNVANGRYEMEFGLWSALSSGTRVAGPLTNSAVNVSNGIFTVTIDFGSGAFNGSGRWLQIGVRTNGSSAAFPLLTPRQPVTPAPYAILAGGLNGILPDSQLSANIPRLNSNQTFSGNVSFTGSGNVGVGTSSPTDAKLDVEGAVHVNDYDIYLRGGSDRAHGVGYRSTIRAKSVDGPFLYGFNGGALGIGAPDDIILAWDWQGTVTIGTTNIPGRLNIAVSPSQTLHLRHDGGLVPGINVAGTGGLAGIMRFRNALEVWPDDTGTRPGYLDVRETNGAANIVLRGNGTATVKVLEITGGADVAEPFPMKDSIEPGSVVIIDDEHPGQLRLSTSRYDTRVAGIVSGAGGVNPGLALRQHDVLDAGKNVALTGRVYVQADATSAPIKPGDLLTTSDKPGHAMKVSDHSRAPGAVIGKAMSSLREGSGLVLVLVSLQ